MCLQNLATLHLPIHPEYQLWMQLSGLQPELQHSNPRYIHTWYRSSLIYPSSIYPTNPLYHFIASLLIHVSRCAKTDNQSYYYYVLGDGTASLLFKDIEHSS